MNHEHNNTLPSAPKGPAADRAPAGQRFSPPDRCVRGGPVLNLLVPASSMFHLSDYAVALVGKIMCYAICALAMDLIWGYTGILSLGHGLFFALGGYAMGMYLMRQIGLRATTKAICPTSWCFWTGKRCPGIGRFLTAFSPHCS
jgi:urea transport system permease protein